MIDVQLSQLQRMVGDLTDDLRDQVLVGGQHRDELDQEWKQATAAHRTAAGFETWLDDICDQAAVAWVLGCVFVRFCEDNSLVDGLWIGGPSEQAPAADAAQQTQAYLTTNFRENERDWLRLAFAHLRELPATHALFDEHNPVWRFDISGDKALDLLEKLRRGVGVGSLATDTLDTRFLGDLYQDLSAHAKKTYALLQTPEFVEEFILDRAFEPALAEFGLEDMKVIDPACGSGHFVLGAFGRLIQRWREQNPDGDIRELTQRALDQVTGVDINPFAIAIARFRLLVAALKVCDLTTLETAPEFHIRLAAGDSLLNWGIEKSRHQGDILETLAGRETFAYYTEDADLLGQYLKPGQYTVVLANPPYITVKDKARNELYRDLYSACSGLYALTIPFAQRTFQLAKRGDHHGHNSGYVGQITSNAFMKREFGKKLINKHFAHEVELTEVIDTARAYIPGHGTPTVVLIGHNRSVSKRYSGPIRAALGIRGEPTQPSNPAKGLVWSAIKDQIDTTSSETEWVSIVNVPRERLSTHPWSLAGGGAADLMELLFSESSRELRSIKPVIGFMAVTRADDVYLIGPTTTRRLANDTNVRPFITGTDVRDYSATTESKIMFPYSSNGKGSSIGNIGLRNLWAYRSRLKLRQALSGTQEQRGLAWFEYSDFHRDRWRVSTKIIFSVVATHNHFTIERNAGVCNRHAPVIMLSENASEEDHLQLLGVLNSSTACFWLKQVSHPKTGAENSSGGGNRWSPEPWFDFYEFTGTKLQEFPLPAGSPLRRTRELDRLAQRLGELTPAAVADNKLPTRERLAAAQREYESVRARMIALQEELDWEVYRHYGLVEEDLTVAEPPELRLGERAFEIVLARKVAAGEASTEWFARHGSTPITELPAHWPDEYRALVEKRIALIESNRNINLIERPECKRRWQTDGWEAMQQAALRSWLLDRLEASALWAGAQPTPLTVAQLADRVRHDEDFRAVLDLWVGNDQYDPAKVLAKLVADEHVPYLPAQRYKKPGLRKRVQWERTWALQRREDANEDVGSIPVPPKYTSADFTKNSYWRNRGKLDVPKERFVSYPNASPDTDGSLLLGWAGWDHVQQAQALATVYVQRKASRWPAENLLPLLAGMVELEPWLHQWHTQPCEDFPMGSPAEFFTTFLDTELSTLNADRATLNSIRGVE